jgi:uncharacterized Tic20 family protein
MDEQQNVTPPAAGELSKDARTWGMICHFAVLAGYVIPFGNVIGPLIVWLMKREEDPFIDAQGKEAVNFQISVIIYAVVCAILMIIVIGIFLLIALMIANFILVIVAGVKANSGESFKYPANIRLIK